MPYLQRLVGLPHDVQAAARGVGKRDGPDGGVGQELPQKLSNHSRRFCVAAFPGVKIRRIGEGWRGGVKIKLKCRATPGKIIQMRR